MSGANNEDPFANPIQQPGMSEPAGGYMPPPSGVFGQASPADAPGQQNPVPPVYDAPAAPPAPPAQPVVSYPYQGGAASGAYQGGAGDPYGAAPAYDPYATPAPGQGALYPTAQAALYPTAPASKPGGKNVLGILALVMPFICLSPVGIILGHLGLRAVKRGEANNRGVALAGLIVSYVFTFAGLPFLIMAFAAGFTGAQDAAKDAAMDADLVEVRYAAMTQMVDAPGQVPDVRIEGDSYQVGDQTVDATADVDRIAAFGDGTDVGVCVEASRGDKVRSLDYDGIFRDSGCPAVGAQPGDPTDPESPDATALPGDPVESEEPLQIPTAAVGECILDPYVGEADAEGNWIFSEVKVVPCDQLHYGEVYASGQSQLAEFDYDAVLAEAEAYCAANYEAYVGIPYAESALYYDYWYPTEQSWAAGDRELTCLVTTLAEDSVGSYQGSGK